MKTALVILTASLFWTIAAAAGEIDFTKLFADGNELIARAQASGQMDPILNPNVCADQKTGGIFLIYSDDLRFSEKAYLVSETGGIERVKRSNLHLYYSEMSADLPGGLSQWDASVMAHRTRVKLACVQSLVMTQYLFKSEFRGD